MENSRPPCHHVIFLKIWDSPLFFFLLLFLCSPLILSQAGIDLSGSGSSLDGPGWEVSRGRGSLIGVGSNYLAVGVLHKSSNYSSKKTGHVHLQMTQIWPQSPGIDMQKSTAVRAQTREENINIQDLGGKKHTNATKVLN